MEKETTYKYIVYCTTNIVNNKIYIGVHKTLNPNVFDGYIGCGVYITQPYTYKYSKTHFQCAVNKYGVANFKRETLAIFNDEDSAYALEEELVSMEFLKRNDVYNMILGGNGGALKTYKHPTYEYDENGNYITEYESILEAAQINGVTHGAIQHAISKKQKALNHFWSHDKQEKIDLSEYNLGLNQKIQVHLYLLTGEYFKSFESLTECGRFCDTSASQIRVAASIGGCIRKKYNCSYVKADSYDVANTEYIKNRTIYQYDINGKFIKEYIQKDAERIFKGSNINKAIKTKKSDKNGFIWGLVKLENYNVPNTSENKKKKVGKYDLSGNLITVYDSATQAATKNGTSVWKVLAGTNKTHKNHIYKYI